MTYTVSSWTLNPSIPYHTFLLDIVYLCQVDQNELTRLILKLKDIKSPGWDNIGSKLIKDNIPVIINPLTHILNLSIIKLWHSTREVEIG